MFPKWYRPKRYTVKDIAQIISAEWGVTPEDIFGGSRDVEFVMARAALVVRLRKQGYSYPRIGRILKRDHTTIMNAERKAQIWRERDPDFDHLCRMVLA